MGFVLRGHTEAVQIRTPEHALGRQKDQRDWRNPVPCLQESFLCEEQESGVRTHTTFILARTKHKWVAKIWDLVERDYRSWNLRNVAHFQWNNLQDIDRIVRCWLLLWSVLGQSVTTSGEVCSQELLKKGGHQDRAPGACYRRTKWHSLAMTG